MGLSPAMFLPFMVSQHCFDCNHSGNLLLIAGSLARLLLRYCRYKVCLLVTKQRCNFFFFLIYQYVPELAQNEETNHFLDIFLFGLSTESLNGNQSTGRVFVLAGGTFDHICCRKMQETTRCHLHKFKI